MTTAYPDAIAKDIDNVINKAIADGNKLVFTTSPRMLQASLCAAIEHPELTVMNCSLNISHRYVRTYYPRMYEVKFIVGVLAGSLTNSDRIGYICTIMRASTPSSSAHRWQIRAHGFIWNGRPSRVQRKPHYPYIVAISTSYPLRIPRAF